MTAKEWVAQAAVDAPFLAGWPAAPPVGPSETDEFVRIANSSDVDPLVRVLAHEALVDQGHPPDEHLAEAYCDLLPGRVAHNHWGMPGEYLERLGRTTVALGRGALPCLSRLLDDRRPLGYHGSEEPTLSAAMGYRVCDLAAYLISEITGRHFENARDPEERDKVIAELSKAGGTVK
jgi:hypothetical protein